MTAADNDSFEVRLPRDTKPSDGDKVATRLADEYPGHEMTKFEPFLGKATLSTTTEELSRCRGAVSNALGVKPWEVQVAQRPDNGFSLKLPKSYVPSKYDDKLDEVAICIRRYSVTLCRRPRTLTALTTGSQTLLAMLL